MLYCSNRASICSHALIFLSQTRWIGVTGWRTSISLQPCVSNTFGLWFLVVYKHQSPPCVSNMSRLWILVAHTHKYPALCFKTRLDYGSVSVCKHQSTALLIKHVWIVDPCLRTRISLQPCVSNTFGLWFRVCVQGSVSGLLLIKHVWIVAPCCVQASVSTRVSNTFCGSWSVYIISLHPFVSNTLDFGFLFVYPPTHTKMR